MALRLVVALAIGCVSTPGLAADDPLEAFNRSMFAFNKGLVDWVVNPTVDHLGPWIPSPVVAGLANAYANLTEVEMVLDNALQGKGYAAAASAGRFAVNSSLGIAGLFDVATPLGLERREANYGVSLCQTGLAPGSYLVLPFVGPTNTVGASALVVGIGLEVYALSFISTTLATADFLIIDLGGSASALRHGTNVPKEGADLYVAQRDEYQNYIEAGCNAAPDLENAALGEAVPAAD